MGKFLLLGLLLTLVCVDITNSAPRSPSQRSYKTYANARFDYSIEYPADLLVPQGESANGDGQIFRANRGDAEMRVYGRNNVNNESLRDLFSKVSREWGHGVTYKVIRQDWFVVSGLVHGKIRYQKLFCAAQYSRHSRLNMIRPHAELTMRSQLASPSRSWDKRV